MILPTVRIYCGDRVAYGVRCECVGEVFPLMHVTVSDGQASWAVRELANEVHICRNLC